MYKLKSREAFGLVLAPEIHDKLTPSRFHGKLYLLSSIQSFYEGCPPKVKARLNRALGRLNVIYLRNGSKYVPIYRMVNRNISLARNIKMHPLTDVVFCVGAPDWENFFSVLSWISRMKAVGDTHFVSRRRLHRAVNQLTDKTYFTQVWDKIVGEGDAGAIYAAILPYLSNMEKELSSNKGNLILVTTTRNALGRNAQARNIFDYGRIEEAEERYEEEEDGIIDPCMPRNDQFTTTINLTEDHLKWLDTLL